MYFGWSCMFWRHPERHSAATMTVAQPFRAALRRRSAGLKACATRPSAGLKARGRRPSAGLKACTTRRRHSVRATRSIRNGRDLPRVERLEKLARRVKVELRILRFDAEEEPVAAGERKPRHVEDRVVRLRQAVERQHAEHRRECRAEDRALEGDRDERRPAVKRLAADVDRIGEHRYPVLERIAAEAADDA